MGSDPREPRPHLWWEQRRWVRIGRVGGLGAGHGSVVPVTFLHGADRGGSSHAPRAQLIPEEAVPDLPGRLFHFTDVGNLPLIRSRGLLSLERCKAHGIHPVEASSGLSRSLDRLSGLHGFVHLCRRPEHPMATVARRWRGVAVVWLQVAPLPRLFHEHLWFSEGNAASAGASFHREADRFFAGSRADDEALVHGCVPARFLSVFDPQVGEWRALASRTPGPGR